MTLTVALLALVAWTALAIITGMVIGRVVSNRDHQEPGHDMDDLEALLEATQEAPHD